MPPYSDMNSVEIWSTSVGEGGSAPEASVEGFFIIVEETAEAIPSSTQASVVVATKAPEWAVPPPYRSGDNPHHHPPWYRPDGNSPYRDPYDPNVSHHPHKEWDGDTSTSGSLTLTPSQQIQTDTITTNTPAPTVTVTDTRLQSSSWALTTPSSSVTSASDFDNSAIPQIQISPTPAFSDVPPPYHHGNPLRFILLGVFLGAGMVLGILGCLLCFKRCMKRRKDDQRQTLLQHENERTPQMQMRSDQARPVSVATIRPPTIIVNTSRTTTTTSPSVERPLIVNPFSDPTYNPSSGVDDYIHTLPSHQNVQQNPFLHADDPDTHFGGVPRPNSQGDFPPDYMTIDSTGGRRTGHREERFPFGDPALSETASVRSLRGPSEMGGGGFGDGFRGYVPRGGLGSDLGQGLGEGFDGHIPDSDASTITESRPSVDIASIRRSSDCPIVDDYPIIDTDRGYVADGFGFRPSR